MPPVGRPSPIDAPIQRPGGEMTTVADLIAQLMRVGCYFETACAAAGIHRDTGHEWLKVAGRARIRAKGANLASLSLSDHEQRCVAFSDAVLTVEAEWESQANAQLERLARGGITLKTETVKTNAQGEVVERTIRTEQTLPDKQVLEWRLTRRFPQRYATQLELPDGVVPSEEEHAEDLVVSLGAFLERKQAEPEKPVRRRKSADG